jgi:hypothetical protein
MKVNTRIGPASTRRDRMVDDKKHTPKQGKGAPEITSGSKGLSRSAPPIVAREKLAKKVETLAVEAFRLQEQSWKKLSELRPLIAQLRGLFMKLTLGEKIAGCTTWTEYCKRILHRTDRRVRQILKGANPASEKHSPKHLQAKMENTPSESTRFVTVNVEKIASEPPRIMHVNVEKVPFEPKIAKVLETRATDWTPDVVVETAFNFVYSVFQEAKLPHDDHIKAVEQLLEKLRHEIVFGH